MRRRTMVCRKRKSRAVEYFGSTASPNLKLSFAIRTFSVSPAQEPAETDGGYNTFTGILNILVVLIDSINTEFLPSSCSETDEERETSVNGSLLEQVYIRFQRRARSPTTLTGIPKERKYGR